MVPFSSGCLDSELANCELGRRAGAAFLAAAGMGRAVGAVQEDKCGRGRKTPKSSTPVRSPTYNEAAAVLPYVRRVCRRSRCRDSARCVALLSARLQLRRRCDEFMIKFRFSISSNKVVLSSQRFLCFD